MCPSLTIARKKGMRGKVMIIRLQPSLGFLDVELQFYPCNLYLIIIEYFEKNYNSTSVKIKY
jgi:hypothetical protein